MASIGSIHQESMKNRVETSREVAYVAVGTCKKCHITLGKVLGQLPLVFQECLKKDLVDIILEVLNLTRHFEK